MKIAIFRGHNTIYNRGANGILKEEEMINDVAFKLINKLKSAGETVIDCTPTQDDFKNIHSTTDSLRIRCQRANDAKVDIVVSIHFNYYNGQAHGSEIFYVSEKGKNLGEPVLNEIVKLGFTNRGMKKNSSLYVLNNTFAPAILIEGCFCDSIRDTTLFDGEKMANAIFKGLTGIEGKFISTAPTASKAQIDSWAKDKFLDSDYKELLDIYWDDCIAKKINPVILFAQMSLETGFLYRIPSQAGIDASYFNPCGLKTTSGGSNTDPNAHSKFKNWKEGITAHIDHMGLYLGLDGYPKDSTPDPRHFPYLKGRVTTVEDLGKTWTVSNTYASILLKFSSEIESTEIIVDTDLEKLSNKVNELETEVSKLQYLYSDLSSEILQFNSKLSSLEDSIQLCTEKIEVLPSVINNLNENIASLQSFVDKTLKHYKDITKA
ncbi:N-acetylmuramoyl-L-alanine amidase [Oceanirhabdus sp. W0125-5]|uniref:N-acetylmuramoyl-L-alanine amidase n=1 Tax=Oceanirhabdus sp. W0125-5 TaxID=2999116 RepID=UPI0022F2FAB9|nr:N-acetylmuramoyl-L-alanine amidase [Oceanirhabdus sp. W0125-5]WBW99664.1 N-acetylmuramoyl-L-alanine amidase [Oceanirhabdus sp. W0125-5]